MQVTKRTMAILLSTMISFLFVISNAAFSAESIMLSTNAVVRGKPVRVSWSGFSGNVNVAVYKGNVFWVHAITDAPGSGFQDLYTEGWDIRSDYKVKIELRADTNIKTISSLFSVSIAVNEAPAMIKPLTNELVEANVPRVILEWGTLQNVTGYQLVVDGITIDIESGKQGDYAANLGGFGAHTWKIRARYSENEYGNWTKLATFFLRKEGSYGTLVFPVRDAKPDDSLYWDVPWNYFSHYFHDMGGYHPGEDWNLVGGAPNADLHAPVYAIAEGTVKKISDLGTLGFLVATEHPGPFLIPSKSGYENQQSFSYPEETVDSIIAVYVHIDEVPSDVVEGGHVNQNQVIGHIMDSGHGPHLHFEIRHPNSIPSYNWSLVGPTSNWAKIDGRLTGYYLNVQQMVDAGLRDPREVINANALFVGDGPARPSTPTNFRITY